MPESRSLSDDFFVIARIIVLTVLLIVVWYSWVTYQSIDELIHQRLESQAVRIDRTVNDAIDYTAYIMNYVTRQVQEHGADDPAFIKELLRSFNDDLRANDLLSWSMFSWVNSDLELSINSGKGILDEPIDLTHRDYIPYTITEPNKIQLGKPVYGSVSKQWVIPAGMGVVNQEGEYLGAMVLGFSVASLTNDIEKSIEYEQTEFTLVSREGKVLAESKHYAEPETKEQHIVDQEFIENRYNGMLSKPELFSDEKDYIYLKPSDKYPYFIILRYDSKYARGEILHALLPRVIEMIAVGGFLILLLWLFQKRLVQPVMVLADAADQIAHGHEKVEIPTQGPAEITKLAEHLEQIQLYVTELRRVRKELVRRNQELEGTRTGDPRMTKTEDRPKSEVVASNISHQLRTPLNAILDFSESFKEAIFSQEANPKLKEYYRGIHKSAGQMLQLLNDWVDLSRLEAGMLEFREEEVSVAEIVDDVVGAVEEQAREKQLLIRREVEQGLPYLRADEARMKQVVLNLVKNAVHFTREGGVIKVIAGTLREGEKLTGLIIKVEDTGVGMKPEEIPRMLSKFVPVNNPLKDGDKKPGLGLPLAHELTELMGGDFHIESEEGKGTTVTITFPAMRFCQ